MKMERILYGALFIIVMLYLYKTFIAPKPPTSRGVHGMSENLLENFEQPHNVESSEQIEHVESSAQVAPEMNRTPSSCFPQKILTANELLPHDDSAAISDFDQDYPIGEGVKRGIDYLSAGYHVGVNTVGQSLRNANRQIRGEPPNPQVSVSPWLNSTIGPDLERRSLDSCKLE